MALPTITITGNLTREPELSYGDNYTRLRFGVAANKNRKLADDTWESTPSFFDVIAWGALAEHAADTLEKGIGVVVIGRIEQRTYTNREDIEVTTFEVTADEIAINTHSVNAVTRRPRGAGSSNGNGQSRQPARAAAPAQPTMDEEPW